ncbi:MAG: peptide-methionine (S)-S-oxide reductase MsrA [Gammaproteobacteria bacterium]
MNHTILNVPLVSDIPDNAKRVLFGMGCFWGVERLFWQLDGVYRTAAGYAGGVMENPDYRTVCSGTTGHTEVVEVVYFPDQISLNELLKVFWENHDPTQGHRQGNDVGSQYRSMITTYDPDQAQDALESRNSYQAALTKSGYGNITTELNSDQTFWIAEEYHQQYLDKNPNGYCGISGTGTCFI